MRHMISPRGTTARSTFRSSRAGRNLLLLAVLAAFAGGAHATCPSSPPTVLTPVCDGSADDTAALQSIIHAASRSDTARRMPRW